MSWLPEVAARTLPLHGRRSRPLRLKRGTQVAGGRFTLTHAQVEVVAPRAQQLALAAPDDARQPKQREPRLGRDRKHLCQFVALGGDADSGARGCDALVGPHRTLATRRSSAIGLVRLSPQRVIWNVVCCRLPARPWVVGVASRR